MRVDRVVAAGAFLWCLAPGVAVAQAPGSLRLVELGGVYATKVGNSDARVSTEIQRSLAGGKVIVPVSLGGDIALLFGLSYEVQRIRYFDVGPSAPPGGLPTPLHALDATAGLVWKLGERWSATALFTPGLHSDLEDVSSRDWIWGGTLLFARAFGAEGRSGQNRIGLGATFSDRFGERIPFPLLLVDWFPSERLFVRGTLPIDLDVGYRVPGPFSVGFGALLKGYQARLTEASPWFGAVVRYREIELGPFLDAGLTGRVRLRVSGGAAVGQHFEFRDQSNESTLVEGDFENGGFARASLYLAL